MKNCFAYRCSFVFLLVALCTNNNALAQQKERLIFSDEFTSALDTSIWKTEIASLPNSTVYVKDGYLFLDTKGGVTVWLNKKLEGNIRIEYTRRVLVDSGANDRLSDLNSFWMATDPGNKNLFTRNGGFGSYDSLKMYYVGMGGNTNKTTRFRKYQGNGEKTLLQEYKDKAHLLEANKEYLITIEVINGVVRYIVNGTTFFEYKDPAVLKEGYFGFRSTKSRQRVDWVKVYRVKN